MGAFGPALQSERQRRGLSLEDVARDTRLARHYLLALEAENLDDLPGGLYNRAYLRTYAEYLALDADRLVQDYQLKAKRPFDTARSNVQPETLATMRAAIRSRAAMPRSWTPFAVITRVGAVGIVVFVLLATAAWLGADYWLQRPETMSIGTNDSTKLPAGRDVEEAAVISTSMPESRPLAAWRLPGRQPKPVAWAPTPEEVRLDDAQGARLFVEDSGVGTDVVDRQLVGASDTFEVGAPVVFWTWVRGGRPHDIVRHVWMHEGRTVGAVDLPVDGASWRTHSRRTLRSGATGRWVVEVRDTEGRVLARQEFRCTP
jgi:transcriptional regulator with XRE-family HTH domain